MNLGLSPELKAHFTDIKPILYPQIVKKKKIISDYKIPDPN
jgi:hypothetical protein